MSTKILTYKNIIQLAAIDILLVAISCMLPVLAHSTSFPLYFFDPMRIVVLAGLLWGASRKNAFLLAVAVPLLTFWVTGHPMLPKGLLIAAELTVNLLLFVWLGRRIRQVFFCMLLSILLSKAVYYLLKWALISTLLPAQPLVGASLGVQLAVAVAISLCFAFVAARQKNSQPH